MIDVHNLTKFYGRFLAVDNISFHINKGEIVGYLGPNGAGKSTTLRMLTGFLPPTSGSASIAGYNVITQSLKARKHIGYLPEHVPLYEDMRVHEYLAFRASIKGVPHRKLRERIGHVTETCGLQSKAKTIIRTLSKGFRQRVGLADSLIADPPLLILDEPTNGLDPNQIRQIRELIKSLAERHTIIVSTHILSEVEMICNKVIILDQGKIKASDTPANLTANLRAAGKISIELKADPEVASKAISLLPHVRKTILEASLPDGWHLFTARADAGSDTRAQIADLCQTNNWPLRHLYRHQPTLEEVFVELTRKD